MQKDIHPPYDYVIFRDTSCGATFRIRSTCQSDKTIVWDDGETYPLVELDVSSASHPFYTGEQRQASSEGRVARFQQRFGKLSSRPTRAK
ncbi:50S ribosomal protein L31 type B [Alcanivorax xiamenensis]|uniref:Large ribosomal subunit protein bL31B n=1 Tax=Alcanivorax xiamenensis TaxID=1177156 RepID=A0ABQ6Y2Z1_9GAMM|nr:MULTISPECIES: type B 50S ribosomal protein L31 [Alcanivorax]KAF0802755.1 50S ribosomal protein L31 type B [Alcanivorax xiamenensis]